MKDNIKVIYTSTNEKSIKEVLENLIRVHESNMYNRANDITTKIKNETKEGICCTNEI